MTNCPHCQAPLISLRSQNIKICADHPLKHVFDNKLKEGQRPLVMATR